MLLNSVLRDVIGAEMLSNASTHKIGGPGKTVEIDEERHLNIPFIYILFVFNY